MKRELLQVSLRKNAILIPEEWGLNSGSNKINGTTSTLLANAIKLGFTFSEDLLHQINGISPKAKMELLDKLKEVTGVNKNWTPLVKQWDVPTGEHVLDHVFTWLTNMFPGKKGIKLPCGHLIPEHTFPIERYNGCPYCGTPFEFEELAYKGGLGKLKTLELWTEVDLQRYLRSLLESPVALDATQVDSLKIMLKHVAFPQGISIKMKETTMLVIDEWVKNGKAESASQLFASPNDILRYLWYKHTGFLQILEPRTIIARRARNARNIRRLRDQQVDRKLQAIEELKMKFTRAECRMYATWLNNLSMKITAQCEVMHPKRGMWVRVIRALRLAEYSKRKGFEQLAQLLDTFYNENYTVWQGRVNHYRFRLDEEKTFRLLKQRPGLFARSLFANMLWFGPEVALPHFREVMDKLPTRFIFTLDMYAGVYFDKTHARTIKPLGGVHKRIPPNQLLELYSEEDLTNMQLMIQKLGKDAIRANFRKVENENKTIFIDKSLYQSPIAIGDRSGTIQDLPGALMGTRFPIEGDVVRLFMQWGEGLRAQHLDMDLSCRVVFETHQEYCSYSQLTIPGCKHSGDIQRIPNKVGTAEYIDIDVNELRKRKAKYVCFTCNAYTNGSLSPNLVVGWMNSQFPMKISKKGVAYDPTAVQHQVRVQRSLTKGLLFGVLDVGAREIVWLEMDFQGQLVQNLDVSTVKALLHKLEAKLKIGELLELKAEVQGLELVPEAGQADEVYDTNWALNTAEVSKLFLG